MTSTSSLDGIAALVEARRIRLQNLLQVAARDFELRFEFGAGDVLGDGLIVLGIEAEQAARAELLHLKGQALHLLGHTISRVNEWADLARREESQGRVGFASLWHALEDARSENWMIARWPGSTRAFATRIPPNLGGSLLALMSPGHQLELGLYFEGRGYVGGLYSPPVREALDAATQTIARGAAGESPSDSLEAMQAIYPLVTLLLRGMHLHAEPDSAREREDRAAIDAETAANGYPPGAAPEIEDTGEQYSVGVMGRRREFPEWFRPGSAPWFERGLGEKKVHPSAVTTDRQTMVDPPRGDPAAYRLLAAEVQREAGFLAYRLTNLIREEVYLRYGGYFRSGKLNMAKVWKQRLGEYRLFQRPISGGPRAMAVTVLLDESASMKGYDKIRIASKAAVLLGEALSQVDVPFEMISYTTAGFEARAAMKLGLTPAHAYRTTRCSRLEHRIYKRFDEPYHAARARLTGLEARCNNWDEEHLLFASRRLQARAEPRKLMVVISDGQPNGDADHLIRTVASLEARRCRVVGVGIGGDFVRQIYLDAVVVTNFRQMAEELLEVLIGEFRGGLALSGSKAETSLGSAL